jgi:hypothetical protein
MPLADCPAISRRREERQQAELLIEQKAAALYATFDKDERVLVRFGMFPAGKMKQLDDELLALKAQGQFPMFDKCDLARLSAVGVMDAANAGPDKLVV